MNDSFYYLADKLANEHNLTADEYKFLLDNRTEQTESYLASLARKQREPFYGNRVFIRGLIEVSNICKNDCLYCGIRKSNENCERYRLTEDQILQCAEKGYSLGFRTFVLQGGEDGWFNDDRLTAIVRKIKSMFPECAITLSLGERSFESYSKLFEAGADRYLLRHETADPGHYASLHPESMSYENRMQCLNDLRTIGFQVGCGFMVGSPGQTNENLVKDLLFIQAFKPDMCGIGPFIPHKDTPFSREKAGDVRLTCYLLSIIRLIHPNILLPATTALGTLSENGRELGLQSGANVVMPNLSSDLVRDKYELYNNKLFTGLESAKALDALKTKMLSIGYEIVTDRGDIIKSI